MCITLPSLVHSPWFLDHYSNTPTTHLQSNTFYPLRSLLVVLRNNSSSYCLLVKISLEVIEGSSSLLYSSQGVGSFQDGSVPDTVTSIGDYAFGSCSALTGIIIPNSVTGIGRNAFFYCKSLTSVTIGSGVTSMGANAFLACSAQTSNFINNSSLDAEANDYWGAFIYHVRQREVFPFGIRPIRPPYL